MKVMVVRQIGDLIAGWLARNLNRLKPAFLGKVLYRAIDSGNPGSGDVLAGGTQYFLRGQRASGLLDDLSDGVTLGSFPLHCHD